MSEMNVSMRLTLLDGASPGLRSIQDLLANMARSVRPLNDQLAILGRRIDSLGTASDKASAGGNRLVEAVSAIGERLGAFEAALRTSVDGLTGLSAGMREATAGAREAAGAIGVASDRIEMAGVKTREATGHISSMSAALRGMAEIWAGLKIEEGLKRTVSAASTYQQTLLRLQVRNLPPGEQQAIVQRARQQARENPLYSVNDTLKANLASIPGLPGNSKYSQDMRAQLMPLALQVAAAAKYIGGDRSSLEHRIQNIFGVVDAMGGASNKQRAHAVMVALSNAMVGGGGKLNLQSIETYLRTRNRAATTTMSMHAFSNEMALLETFKSAGGGGAGGNTRGATLLNAILQMSYGGMITKAGAELMRQIGLVDAKAITPYGKSSTMAVLAPGALLDAPMAQNDTADWVQKIMIPRMLAYTRQNWKTFGYHSGSTKDLNNIEQAANAIAILSGYLSKMRVGGQTLGSGLSILGNPASAAAIHADAQQMRSVQSPSQINAEIQKTFAGRMDVLHHQLENLGLALGVTVIPALTKFVGEINRAAAWFGRFAQNHKVISFFVELGGAVGSALMVFQGFGRFMGFDKPVISAFKLITNGGIWAAKRLFSFGDTAIAAAKSLSTRMGEALDFAGTTLGEIASFLVKRVFLPAYLLLHSTTLDVGERRSLAAKKAQADALVANGYTPWGTKMPAGKRWMPPGAHTSPGPSPEELAFADLLKRMQATHIPGGNPLQLGGVAAGGAAHKRAQTPQELAAGWGLQDLHRASQQAAAEARAAQAPIDRALAQLQSTQQHDSPQAVQQHWDQVASQLASSTDPATRALAPQAQAIGRKKALQMQLQQAKANLSGLQSALSSKAKYNAALVTAGVLTPDQAQQRTLADQRAAAPGILQAAEAVKQLEQQAGQSTTTIDTLIVGLKRYGDGLTQFQQKIYNGFESAFAGLFDGLMKHQKTMRQQLEAFFQSLANTMMQTMSQQLAQGLMQGMMGAGTPGGSALRSMGGVGQIGKMMGAGVSGWLGGMFASSNNGTGAYTTGGQVYNNPSAYTSSSSTVASNGFWSGIGSWLASIGSSFAAGADYVPHDMVAQIHQGEMIVPKKGADAIRSGALAGHQSNFNGNVNVTVQHNGMSAMSGNGNAAQQSLGMMVGEHVRQIMLQEMRPGGLLAGARP